MSSVILGEMSTLSLSQFENSFIYYSISLVVDTFSPREINFLLNSEDYDMKILKFFSLLEFQCGWVRLDITIHS